MSLARGESKSGDRKASWLPLSWGVRFAIAVTGTVVLWWRITSWMKPGEGCTACTTLDIAWILTKVILIPLLDLFFLGWTAKLLWEQKLFCLQWNRLTNRQQAFFSAVFVAGTALYYVVIHYAAHIILPSIVREIYLKSYIGFIVIWVSSFCWVSHRNVKLGTSADSSEKKEDGGKTEGLRRWWSATENRINFLSVFIIALAFVNPGSLSENLAWATGIVILVQLLVRLRGWIVGLAFRGHYDWAIWLNRMFYWAPGYGRSYEGWILAEAGRYQDALTRFKPMAFDRNGQLMLKSWELYLYALALLGSGEDAAAQELFEAAAQEEQQELKGYFHLGLADSLLAQKKEADRARDLIAQVLTEQKASSPLPHQSTELVNTTGFYAFALASCGQRDEALEQLQKATSGSTAFKKRDLAALKNIEGLTWRALGDAEKARDAFEEALLLHPHGNIAVRVRRELAELSGKSDA